MLNTEFDQLEESNKEIKEQIQKIVERGKLSNIEKENLEKSLQDECHLLQDEIQQNLTDAENTKKMFKKVQLSVSQMVDMFKKSKFFLCVAQKMSYEDGIIFTENNIVSYLAELEEYISSLITYTAFKKDEPNAAICSIPLEKLNQKDFQKKNITIDPPVDYTIQQDMQPGQVDVGLGGQETGEIIGSKELYAKFMSLVD
mmetsp:Transcript_8618/g.13352  ORF Transcript_8618/g.13352 Transcript_8618/m.13352 type:complete len:200 (+) Transcript_8618:860-1459(+)